MATEIEKKRSDDDMGHALRTAHRSSPSAHRRILNVRALVISLLLLAIIAPAAWVTHRLQVRRIAKVFLDRATEYESNSDWENASARISSYLRLHPDDDAQRIRLAETYFRSVAKEPSNGARAAALLYRAIGVAESAKAIELRRQLGAILNELGRFKSAQDLMVQQPRRTEPDEHERRPLASAEDRRILAIALHGRFQDGAVPGIVELSYPSGPAEQYAIGELLELAVAANAADAKLARTLAELYRHHRGAVAEAWQNKSDQERADEADRVMAAAVAAEPTSARNLLALYYYNAAYHPQDAEQVLERALVAGKDDVDVLLAAAKNAVHKANAILSGDRRPIDASNIDNTITEFGGLPEVGSQELLQPSDNAVQPQANAKADEQYTKAVGFYRQILEIEPDNEEALFGLGYVSLQQRDPEAAIATWKDAASRHPFSATLQLSLAGAYLSLSDFSEAEKRLDAAQQIALENESRISSAQRTSVLRRVQLGRGRMYLLQRRFGEAVPQLRLALTVTAVGELDTEGVAFNAHAMLARCYEALAQWELAAREFEELAKMRQADPSEVLYRFSAATAWISANSGDNASRNLEDLVGRYDSAELWMRIAHARFVSELQRPERERNWARVDEAIAKCRLAHDQRPLNQPWRMQLLEAEIYAAQLQSGSAEARDAGLSTLITELRGFENQFQNQPVFLAHLIPLYERLNLPEDADRVLKAYEKSQASATQIALIKSELLAIRKQYESAREVLVGAMDAADATEKERLQLALSQIVAVTKDSGAAMELFDNAEALPLQKLRVGIYLAEAALAERQWDEARKWEEKLRSVEGPEGVYWRALRARRLLSSSSADDAAVLTQVERLQTYVAQKRPNWPVAHTIKAAIELRLGRVDEGVAALHRAVELGERRIEILQDLILLLYQQNRLAEADRIFSLIDKSGARSAVLSEVEFEVARKQGETDRALELAKRELEENPNNVDALLRLGQAQLLTDQPAEAEESLRKAVDVDETAPKPWLSLFHFYLRSDQHDQARQTLEALLAKAKFPPAKISTSQSQETDSATVRALVAAQCYELLGDVENAADSYQQAAVGTSKSVESLLQLAFFKRRQRDWDGAIEAMQQAKAIAPDNPVVKKTLAALYLARGKDGDLNSALELVEEGGATPNSSDLQIRAVLLSRRTGKDYRKNLNASEQLLRDLVTNQATADRGNRALLARVLTNQGVIAEEPEIAHQKLQEARDVYLTLINEETPVPTHVLDYIRLLLLQGDRDEAQRALPNLEQALVKTLASPLNGGLMFVAHLHTLGFREDAQLALSELEQTMVSSKDRNPSSLETFIALALELNPNDKLDRWLTSYEELSPKSVRALEFRAVWLSKIGREDDIVPLVDAFLARATVNSDAGRVNEAHLSAGNLYLMLKMTADAKRAFGRISPELPQFSIAMMRVAIAEENWQQAVEHCAKAIPHYKSAAPIILLVSSLSQSSASSIEIPALERMINEALSRHLDDPDLMISLANLRIAQGRAQEGVALLQNALDQRARNPIALNNMANVLAEVPGRQQEALDLVHQAIQLDGPAASMLDTKGVALLHAQRVEEAIQWFQAAANLDDTTPIHGFHLAVAYDRTGNTKEAQALLEAAIRRGIDEQILTPADQRMLTDLRSRYELPPNEAETTETQPVSATSRS